MKNITNLRSRKVKVNVNSMMAPARRRRPKALTRRAPALKTRRAPNTKNRVVALRKPTITNKMVENFAQLVEFPESKIALPRKARPKKEGKKKREQRNLKAPKNKDINKKRGHGDDKDSKHNKDDKGDKDDKGADHSTNNEGEMTECEVCHKSFVK